MDCIGHIDTERLKLDGRPVSNSFHFAIRQKPTQFRDGCLVDFTHRRQKETGANGK